MALHERHGAPSQHGVQDQPGQPGQPGQPDRQDRQRPIQTLARAYAAITAQTDPWVALNEFFHEWWDYSRTERARLVAEEVLPGGPSALLDIPPNSPSDLSAPERNRRWRWAVFCAAAADYLCERAGMAPPAWVADPRYTLAEPWYVCDDLDGAGNTAVGGTPTPEARAYRAHLERTTPAPLRRRNILCGARAFANKYEFAEQIRRLVASRAAHAGGVGGREAVRDE
jgi:hypothetical protein